MFRFILLDVENNDFVMDSDEYYDDDCNGWVSCKGKYEWGEFYTKFMPPIRRRVEIV
jgi:hypothetical protein